MIYGLDIEKQKTDESDTDWRFGAASIPCIAQIPVADRQKYLPKGELQFGAGDFEDCTSRGPINILQTKFNYLYQTNRLIPANKKWLEDKGYVQDGHVVFSKRFTSIKSGTTPTGNSIIAPIHSIHADGLIPEIMLPQDPSMTWNTYNRASDITPAMVALGQAFLKRFQINYEAVAASQFASALEADMLDVAGFAWLSPVNGVYPDPGPSQPFCHVFQIYGLPAFYVFDNYVDGFDGDFIKLIDPHYTLYQTGYRIFITSEMVDNPADDAQLADPQVSWFIRLLRYLGVL